MTLQKPSRATFRRRSSSIARKSGFHCRLSLQAIHDYSLSSKTKHPPNISVWLALVKVDEIEETRNEISQLELGFNIDTTLRVSVMLCYEWISDSQCT